MTKGPKVSLNVVCDGCEYYHSTALLSHPPQYRYECSAPDAPELGKRVTVGHPIIIYTPHWCPYRDEAVKAVIG